MIMTYKPNGLGHVVFCILTVMQICHYNNFISSLTYKIFDNKHKIVLPREPLVPMILAVTKKRKKFEYNEYV